MKQTVLLERRLFLLNDEQFSEFMALLDVPPSTNENLRQLLATSSPWDEEWQTSINKDAKVDLGI